MYRVLLSWGLIGLASTACGGDDEGPPTFSTGIETSRAVNELSESEVESICEQSARFVQDLFESFLSDKSWICNIAGVLASEDRASCESIRDVCLDMDLSTLEIPEIEPDCEVEASRTACDLSVGEVETCFNAQLSLFDQAFDGLSCDQAGREDLFDDLASSVPAECMELEAKCPDLLTDGDVGVLGSMMP